LRDWGYHESLPEQSFEFGALLFTRVISKPAANHVCLDLGYKAIASENPLHQRFYFPEQPDWIPKFQSEEHLVLEVPAQQWEGIMVGASVYVIPYHICPTVAWYPFYQVVDHQQLKNTWAIASRY
ncbi:MAG: D-TA family PLP-dependent enzyme, partial [Sphingobacterium sp.]